MVEAEQNRADIQALQDQLVAKQRQWTDKNPTEYTTKFQQLLLEPSIRQEHTSPYTDTSRSSWRETRYTPTPISLWRETRGPEQIPRRTQSSSQWNNESQFRWFPPLYFWGHESLTTLKMEMVEVEKYIMGLHTLRLTSKHT